MNFQEFYNNVRESMNIPVLYDIIVTYKSDGNKENKGKVKAKSARQAKSNYLYRNPEYRNDRLFDVDAIQYMPDIRKPYKD